MRHRARKKGDEEEGDALRTRWLLVGIWIICLEMFTDTFRGNEVILSCREDFFLPFHLFIYFEGIIRWRKVGGYIRRRMCVRDRNLDDTR